MHGCSSDPQHLRRLETGKRRLATRIRPKRAIDLSNGYGAGFSELSSSVTDHASRSRTLFTPTEFNVTETIKRVEYAKTHGLT